MLAGVGLAWGVATGGFDGNQQEAAVREVRSGERGREVSSVPPENEMTDALRRRSAWAETVTRSNSQPLPPAAPDSSEDAAGEPLADGAEPVIPTAGIYPAEMVDALCRPEYTWDCSVALAICWAEMGRWYQPWAVNPVPIWLNGENHATGMCQLLMPLHAGYFNPGDPLNPYDNARAAFGLWLDDGGTFCGHWFYWGIC